jgi:ribosomal protein S18 acetylase RimI-like enzyme
MAKMQSPNIEELIDFANLKLWEPHYPETLVRRFLSELISGPNMILDLHDAQGRVAAAVLLDLVNNVANDACLEILGIRRDPNVFATLRQIVSWAVERAPANRNGIQIALSDKTGISPAQIESLGFKSYYDAYEMRRSKMPKPIEPQPRIRKARESDAEPIYAVFKRAFASSPDASIPEFPLWKNAFMKMPQFHFYVWEDGREIVGFAQLVEEKDSHEAEVRTIGVLPARGGKGIGRHLLEHCIDQARKLNCQSCRLTVSVQNEKALALYSRAGFAQIEKYRCFRADFSEFV